MTQPPMLRIGPVPDAVIAATSQLAQACRDWHPVSPADLRQEDAPSDAVAEYAGLCGRLTEGDIAPVVFLGGALVGIVCWLLVLRPACQAVRWLASSLRHHFTRN